MVSTVTEITRRTVTSAGYEDLSAIFGILALLLLLLFLLPNVILSVYADDEITKWRRAVLSLAIRPLSLAFGLVVLMRLLSLA